MVRNVVADMGDFSSRYRVAAAVSRIYKIGACIGRRDVVSFAAFHLDGLSHGPRRKRSAAERGRIESTATRRRFMV